MLIGIKFAIIKYKIIKLRIVSFKKGLGEVIITGMIVFVILFLPISIFVHPYVLIDTILINIGITAQRAMMLLQESMTMINTIMIGINI